MLQRHHPSSRRRTELWRRPDVQAETIEQLVSLPWKAVVFEVLRRRNEDLRREYMLSWAVPLRKDRVTTQGLPGA